MLAGARAVAGVRDRRKHTKPWPYIYIENFRALRGGWVRGGIQGVAEGVRVGSGGLGG